MNHQPLSGFSNNNFGDNSNLVNKRLSSSLFESNNTSFHDCDNDFVNSDASFSEYDNNFEELSVLSYQYNLHVGDCFNDWEAVDRFIHNYCFEWGFRYQAFRNDKDQNDPDISRRKSYCCSSGSVYKARKVIDQNSRRLRSTTKKSCEWHCNFTLPKTSYQIKCTTLKNTHSHQINPAQVSDISARYRCFSDEMIQDINFFLECKVASITQLELLKKKYPQHVFHRQDVYNAIYKLRQNDNESMEIFEQRWEFMVKTFPGCEHYMTKKLYINRISWAKAYAPFQFNAGIQSTQSVESFNSIIKKSLNNASTLCEVEKDLCIDIISDNFIEDVVDEPQATLKAILDSTNMSNIIEKLRICRIGGLSHKDNLVVLLNDETHISNNILQSLRNFQSIGHQSNIQRIIPQKNKFGIAFSTAKMAINVALETKSDDELIQLLKTFILTKQNSHNKNDNLEEAESSENNLNSDSIITLQQDLIKQTNDLHVTKI
ncbi:19883_t:CDS:2 [Racocetra fulgida]|uniref:19883_t:CDS:1 n=1 Tax=Racocetra fulgida TaxID=60492 RepID=A0A9N9EGU6_9GLOM|nr:19883_t:CDS:2 [Racocetra fulgida]